MAVIDTDQLISITEANRIGVSGLIRKAEEGCQQIVLRNNKPVAAVVSIERLEELQELENDLADIALATARVFLDAAATGNQAWDSSLDLPKALEISEEHGQRYSLDEVLERFGYTREQFRELSE